MSQPVLTRTSFLHHQIDLFFISPKFSAKAGCIVPSRLFAKNPSPPYYTFWPILKHRAITLFTDLLTSGSTVVLFKDIISSAMTKTYSPWCFSMNESYFAKYLSMILTKFLSNLLASWFNLNKLFNRFTILNGGRRGSWNFGGGYWYRVLHPRNKTWVGPQHDRRIWFQSICRQNNLDHKILWKKHIKGTMLTMLFSSNRLLL